MKCDLCTAWIKKRTLHIAVSDIFQKLVFAGNSMRFGKACMRSKTAIQTWSDCEPCFSILFLVASSEEFCFMFHDDLVNSRLYTDSWSIGSPTGRKAANGVGRWAWPGGTFRVWWCLGGEGTKNTFLFACGACWILVPHTSVSGKTLFKFRSDVFSVGSQNLNIMCQGQESWPGVKPKIDFSRSPDTYFDASWPEKYSGVFSFSLSLQDKKLHAINLFKNGLFSLKPTGSI